LPTTPSQRVEILMRDVQYSRQIEKMKTNMTHGLLPPRSHQLCDKEENYLAL
jgi:hypothetical protein